MSYDVFISHASEDKQTVAMPLSDYLAEHQLSVWLDANERTLGDSLRSAIDRGLREAKFGVVILSPAFIAKVWPRRELGALFALERGIDAKVILPVRHNLDREELLDFSPMLADRFSISTSEGIDAIGNAVIQATLSRTHAHALQTPVTRQRREDIVSGLHQRLFLAAGDEDIRRIMFELEVHIERYPQDVEARILLDTASRAYRYRVTSPHDQSSGKRATRGLHSAVWTLLALLALLGLGIYLLIRWLWP